MPDDKTYYHNQGEKDASEGKDYNPPYSSALWGFSNDQSKYDANNQYDKGWHHANGQKDYNDSKGSKPSEPYSSATWGFSNDQTKYDANNDYWKGWENAKENDRRK